MGSILGKQGPQKTKKKHTLPETNSKRPENGWLEDEFPFGKAYFQGLLLLVSGGVFPFQLISDPFTLTLPFLKMFRWDFRVQVRFFRSSKAPINIGWGLLVVDKGGHTTTELYGDHHYGMIWAVTHCFVLVTQLYLVVSFIRFFFHPENQS